VNVRFLTLAQQEVDEAFIWFDERTDGKGLDFLDELDRVVRLVKAYPLGSRPVPRGGTNPIRLLTATPPAVTVGHVPLIGTISPLRRNQDFRR
jgi:hypothetical protein